jgi:nucleoside-diphosphate-sugar epimerase
MSNKKILVVGATGGIGRSTVKSLVEAGHSVRVLVRNKEKAKKYFSEFDALEIFEGDASNYGSVYNAAAETSAMFYCLNIPYLEWYEKAILYLTNALDTAAEHNLRFVFPGNVYLYGHAKYNHVDEKHPHDPHTRKGKIRAQMEALIKKYSQTKNLEFTIVRFPDFYGPFVINGFSELIFINSLKGKKLIWVGDKVVPKEYIFIEDAGKCIVDAGLSEKGKNQEFNVPSCGTISNKDFLGLISKCGGKNSKVQLINNNFVFSALGMVSPVIKELIEMLYLKREEFFLDGTKFKNTFGYLPSTDYETGIKKTFEWVKSFYKI